MSNPILSHFNYKHLPSHLQQVSKPICDLALAVDRGIPEDPEKHEGLRKLLEAKDCFVRAAVSKGLLGSTTSNPILDEKLTHK